MCRPTANTSLKGFLDDFLSFLMPFGKSDSVLGVKPSKYIENKMIEKSFSFMRYIPNMTLFFKHCPSNSLAD